MALKVVVAKVRSLLTRLNADSVMQICLLPSMGIKRSKKIVELRSSKGDNTLKLADLTSVRGIGTVALSKMIGSDQEALARVVDYCKYYRSHYQQEVCS